MAKLTRVIQKTFGSLGPAGDFGVFGSKANPPQTFSQDPVAIQSLQAFLQGWGQSIVGNYQPPMEDMNSLFLLAFRQLAYIFQEGIPEWETGTSYYIGSLCKLNGIIYNSLVDNNFGNDPSIDSGTNWQQGFGGTNGGVPTGVILAYGGMSNDIPAGYLLGDGSAISRVTYKALFNKYGTMYGAGNGSTTFNLPNGKGRVLIGADGTAEFLSPGVIGGEKNHVLTIAETPVHGHIQGDGWNSPIVGSAAYGTASAVAARSSGYGDSPTVVEHPLTSSVGGGEGHNNIQPYLVVGGIIVKI